MSHDGTPLSGRPSGAVTVRDGRRAYQAKLAALRHVIIGMDDDDRARLLTDAARVKDGR